MYRLEDISKEISDLLLQSTLEKQKEALVKSCEYAINKTKINNTLVFDILERFRNGDNIEANKKQELKVLIDRFDDEYLTLQEAEENNEYAKGSHLIPFEKARALSAILYCFENDLCFAANEAIYEASMVTDDNSELFLVIKKVLTS
jgi:hypothetical protein